VLVIGPRYPPLCGFDKMGGSMVERVQSDFLFAQPSYLSGAGSVLDLWGTLTEYNSSSSAAEADAQALASDWCVIGQDIFDAMQEYAPAE